MSSDPKDVPPAGSDPHGRDHGDGLAAESTREDVERDARFADSRDEGVVDEHNYLDDVGEAVASAVGSLTGADADDAKAPKDDPKDAPKRGEPS